MALFHAGQIIVYGNLGVCKVEDISYMHFFEGAPREYYTLRPFFTKSNDKIYVPTSTGTFMRPILKPEEVTSSLAALKAVDVPLFCSRSQASMVLHYQDMMQHNELLERLRLFKELCQKEQMQKRKGRKLSPTEQHFYKLTEQLLSEEFALAMDETPAAMRTTLHRAALS